MENNTQSVVTGGITQHSNAPTHTLPIRGSHGKRTIYK